MAKYRKKPVVIEAVQWKGNNADEVEEKLGLKIDRELYYEVESDYYSLIISTLEGDMKAREGDYIIKGVQGEFYPCKPDIFESTYEKVE